MNPLSAGPHAFDIDGLVQRYHVRGTGAAVCVAIPGGPGLSWDYLRMPAIEPDLRVVYLEPLGTGRSSRLATHPHGYSREAYAAALDRLLDHLGRDRVHLLGHGHGGQVAQYYAMRHPDRLAGLILYGSSPVAGPEHDAESEHQLDRFIRRNQWNPEMPAVVDAVRSLPRLTGGRQLTAAVRRAMPAYLAHYWARAQELAPMRARLRMAVLSGVTGRTDPIDDRAALPGIRLPTLVAAGSYDIVGGLRWGRELHALIPYARLLVLAFSGHLAHVEEPERFAEAVLDFVSATQVPAWPGAPVAPVVVTPIAA